MPVDAAKPATSWRVLPAGAQGRITPVPSCRAARLVPGLPQRRQAGRHVGDEVVGVRGLGVSQDLGPLPREQAGPEPLPEGRHHAARSEEVGGPAGDGADVAAADGLLEGGGEAGPDRPLPAARGGRGRLVHGAASGAPHRVEVVEHDQAGACLAGRGDQALLDARELGLPDPGVVPGVHAVVDGRRAVHDAAAGLRVHRVRRHDLDPGIGAGDRLARPADQPDGVAVGGEDAGEVRADLPGPEDHVDARGSHPPTLTRPARPSRRPGTRPPARECDWR